MTARNTPQEVAGLVGCSQKHASKVRSELELIPMYKLPPPGRELVTITSSTTTGNGVKIRWDKIPARLNRGRNEFTTTCELPMGLSGLTNFLTVICCRNESPGTGPILAQS